MPSPLRSVPFALLLSLPITVPAAAQTFTRLTTTSNPVVADPGAAGFVGASWIDFDDDGRQDLFVTNVHLYRNLGAGAFVRVPIPGVSLGSGLAGASGNSWADFDNDGDADLMLSGTAAGTGARGSRLYRNDGAAGFVRVTGGAIGDSLGLPGWGCAWGDYDADGFADLVIANLSGTSSAPGVPSHLLRNRGDGGFDLVTDTDVTAAAATHNVPSWSDFDLDGDLDLSIGNGPFSAQLANDHFFRNRLREGGAPALERITPAELATGFRQGQVVNWIDYDNDGDLDAFVTSYSSQSNHLLRNDGGTWVRVLDAGTIVTDSGNNLASVWNDYDNDGDLDCFVTRDNPVNGYYRNEGNGTFTGVAMGVMTQVGAFGACAADYDQDGDVDLFLGAPGFAKGLYRNDLPAGRHWLRVRLAGTQSNRSAIGARVRVRAVIGGHPVWQLREVSAQNSYNGHSAFEQHFGLGDAAQVDSLLIEWPRGRTELLTALPVDTVLRLVEGDAPTGVAMALVRATADGARVTLEWHASGGVPRQAVVERRASGGTWQALGPASCRADRVWFVDAAAPAGRTGYRLAWEDEDGAHLTPAIEVEVARAALALRARGTRLEFTLPHAGRARVELFDLAGRRVRVHDLGALAAGAHVHDLAGGRRMAAGLHLVRLVHDAGAVAAKAIVTH